MAFKHMLMWIRQATLPPDTMAGYRPSVLTDPEYWTDEPIEMTDE
jgi:hypothetical protein